MVAEAKERVENLSTERVAAEIKTGETTLIIDVCEEDERLLEGAIPKAVHVPRGMLELSADPASPFTERSSSILTSHRGSRLRLRKGARCALLVSRRPALRQVHRGEGLAALSGISRSTIAELESRGAASDTEDVRCAIRSDITPLFDENGMIQR